MFEIFGNFIEQLPPSQEYLVIGFSPISLSLKQRWRNNGLSADFIADYLTTFFPGKNKDSQEPNRQAAIKGAVSFIANELLENAMKFNDDKSQYPISIQVHLEVDKIIILINNSVRPDTVDKFQIFLKELLSQDANTLYIQQLEKNAADPHNQSSQLGYLTMINDYHAQLGWKFETIQEHPKVVTVTTMVQLAV